MIKLKQQLKELFFTKEGWIGWSIANVLTSLPWAVPLIIGFILKDDRLYIVASAVWAFLISPLAPIWIPNVFIAIWIKNILLKRGRSTPEQRVDQKGRTNQ
jgi:hypothetical protein